MKKSDLEARKKQLSIAESDSENDFDEIVSSARNPNEAGKIMNIPLEKLITHRFPLEQINEALKTNLAMEGLKIAVINE